ncbi:MAG: rhodanese-like domain-containing protein [Pelatocladus maniniholoensis HA4357-MV3]|jgi:rhodanese-related sulfurtransferase|uniref:Rhodanese-like domain-containing protein n=1 Tax=Pelatocladus maniniholoensis HA4357-MV3 TaxID=1117104 RepID=A0A9E3LUK3_9NOST|nr:rhodanese-like domain-containing protein [Pelatocladus maniniholoensis HA4357-MV3]BAZ65275.1 rhodanese domain-containing protein [Fischerella sp. NIES-4106]
MLDSVAHDLKSRLELGQPGFTILDVRDRSSYNTGHITGAVPIPLADLADRAKIAFHSKREIFVYGENDKQAAEASQLLKEAGFAHVCEIKGGLSAWKTAGGATVGA